MLLLFRLWPLSRLDMFEKNDLLEYSVARWYENFKNVTLKTIVVEICPELLSKLEQGISDFDIEDVCSKEYIEQIKNAIASLGGTAFVKNNWHAPMDAKFISFGNALKVTNLSDMFLYLSASDIIMNDLNNGRGITYYIALKPWVNIHPASEFRCIVINDILRGITPRDWPTYYAHFSEEGQNIIGTLTKFFNENVKNKFPKKNYTFDVVIAYPDNPFILDFGPLSSKTDLYAFGWPEIQAIIEKKSTDEVAPVFRFIESDIGIMTKIDGIRKFAMSN